MNATLLTCDCNNDLEYYKDKEGNKVFRLLKYSNCVSCKNKKTYLEPETQTLI